MFAGQLVSEHGTEIDALIAGELGEDRRQFVLRVDGPALVGFAIEVDSQVRNRGNGRLEVDQLAFDFAVPAEGDAPGQGQVAVEPWRQQRAAIHFHPQLPEPVTLQLRLGLDPQARAVGVGADQADAVVQRCVAAQLEGNDRRVVARDVVATVGLGGPGLAFVEALITRRLQALGKAGGGMERGRGGLEEVDQALVQLCAHK